MAERGGQPGNNNATKSKPFWSAIDRAIAQDNGKKLREAAEKLLSAAAAGEQWAVKELGDRLDGKAHQSIDAKVDADVTIQVLRFSDVASDADNQAT
jgi:hypothetical protein